MYSSYYFIPFSIESPTTKPTGGSFLFDAKAAKFFKGDAADGEGDSASGEDAATGTLFETIFGKDDGDNKDLLRKKALWEWQQGHN